MDLKKLNVQEMSKKEMRIKNGGGDLIRAFWYVVGQVGGAYANAVNNERADGGTIINWKN